MGRISAFALLLLLPACHDSNGGGDGAAPNVSMATVKLTAPSAGSVALPTEHHAPTVCRAIGASGPIQHDQDGGGILPGELLTQEFVELGAGGKLSVKNGTTTREMISKGPARCARASPAKKKCG